MGFEVPFTLGFQGRAHYPSLILLTGYAPLLQEYVYFLLAKLAFHKQHPEFNGETIGKKSNMDCTETRTRSFRV